MSLFHRDRNEGQLFNDGHLSDVLRAWAQHLDADVQRIDTARLLATEPSAWVEHLTSRFAKEPLRVQVGEVTASPPSDAEIDVSHDARFGRRFDGRPTVARGTKIAFHVPFSGDPDLFRYRPSSSYISPMRARVAQGELIFTYLMTQGTRADEVKREFDHELGLIAQVAANVAVEVEAWNSQLSSAARSLVDRRREKLLADAALVGAFGFPVRARPGAAETFAVPTSRRRIEVPPTPRVTTTTPAPDPALDMATFEAILDVCRNMSLVMERSPRAFSALGEEDLRTHFLVQLNAHFEGSATGETFNVEGKTDILVRHGGRNIFIAECKMWKGPESLRRAIDQVLGYLAWRDTKAAVFLFNRNRDFSAVVEQLSALVRGHPAFRRDGPGSREAEVRAVLANPTDPARELNLAVLAFDVPA